MKTKKHNFGFTTKCEVFDKQGNLVSVSEQDSGIKGEGKIKCEVYDKHGVKVAEKEQPMRSFVKGMIEEFIDGKRIALRNDSYGDLPQTLGKNNSPVYVQQRALVDPYVTYATNALTASSISSSTAPTQLDSLTEGDDEITAVLSTTRGIGGCTSIGEVALWGDGDVMIARDGLEDFTFEDGSFVKITWTLSFVKSGNGMLLKNWIQNFVQNIADVYTDFKNTSGTAASGVKAVTTSTFTSKTNMVGGGDDLGIVVGSGNTSVDYSDYALDTLIADGNSSGELTYSTTTFGRAKIHPLQGTADAVYSRQFQNNSGAAITIKEAGLVGKTSVTTEGIGAAGSYLLARWLTGDVTVQDGYTLKVSFIPVIHATPEVHTGLTDVIIVTDEMRDKYEALENISMIQNDSLVNGGWALAMAQYTFKGFEDWRLPTCSGNKTNMTSANEIYAGLWVHREEFNPQIPLDNRYYWSSRENSATSAWYLHFRSDALMATTNKTSNGYRRRVR